MDSRFSRSILVEHEGIFIEDPTIAGLLKPHSYVSAQIGKNQLGDRDEYLPTSYGFDEFFGNLFHLNAEKEFENPDSRKLDFIDRSVKSGKPFFLWHNTTRMHNWTHLSEKYANKTGLRLPISRAR